MRGLSPSEVRSLDEDGYTLFHGVLEPREVNRLRAALAEVFAERPDHGGTRHVDMLQENADFEGIARHPVALEAARHVIGRPFHLFQLSGREPLPGFGLQGLHTDWLVREPSEPFTIITAVWMLDDFTPHNGATRLVPGSHKDPRPIPRSMAAPAHRHPGQIIVTAAAGSVLIFNGHLWHGGTRNQSTAPRRALQCQYVARDRLPYGGAGGGG